MPLSLMSSVARSRAPAGGVQWTIPTSIQSYQGEREGLMIRRYRAGIVHWTPPTDSRPCHILGRGVGFIAYWPCAGLPALAGALLKKRANAPSPNHTCGLFEAPGRNSRQDVCNNLPSLVHASAHKALVTITSRVPAPTEAMRKVR